MNFETKEGCHVKNYRNGNNSSWTKVVVVKKLDTYFIYVKQLMSKFLCRKDIDQMIKMGKFFEEDYNVIKLEGNNIKYLIIHVLPGIKSEHELVDTDNADRVKSQTCSMMHDMLIDTFIYFS